MDSSRRRFLKVLGGSATLLPQAAGLSALFQSCAQTAKKISSLHFATIAPDDRDDLVLAEGFEYNVILEEGASLGKNLVFGSNNDYLAFFPFDKKATEGLLWVNNESPGNIRPASGSQRTRKNIDLERSQVGASVVHIKKHLSRWKMVPDSPHNRRLDGTTPIPLIAPRPIEGSRIAEGTIANCGGGVTPWKTVLTCEENYDHYYGEREFPSKKLTKAKYHWDKFYKNPPEHYGFVVEVDPMTGKGHKLTSLGRFAHESATVARAKNGRVVVYSGDDINGGFLYKFISLRDDSLREGELFVADLKRGRWLSLAHHKSVILRKHFKDQLDVLLHCRAAGEMLGATPLARPEDIEVHPHSGEVFVALTNHLTRLNFYGSILKIAEEGGNHGASRFQAQEFLAGGKDFACPDNLAFDPRGNLWMVTDISEITMNRFPYGRFKNNGLFYIPLAGTLSGQAFQIASAPVDAELTGITFSPDEESLFVSVQHPGKKSKYPHKLTSHWPGGGSTIPKSAVVEIYGKSLQQLIGRAT